MTHSMRLSLRGGEKIYINGAVLRVDRKVSLELLNDVTFLLESHVLQLADAGTPLRQLYFVVQMMLIDPNAVEAARERFDRMHPLLLGTFENREILAGLKEVDALVCEERYFEALKVIRGLFPSENAILKGEIAAPNRAA
jgi:flagellar protein FlbT